MKNQLPLSGGRNLSDEAHMPLGDLYPLNLTPTGRIKDYTDGEIFRAIREGADRDRRRLPVMSEGFIATMRTGTTPFGKKLDSLKMPWVSVGLRS